MKLPIFFSKETKNDLLVLFVENNLAGVLAVEPLKDLNQNIAVDLWAYFELGDVTLLNEEEIILDDKSVTIKASVLNEDDTNKVFDLVLCPCIFDNFHELLEAHTSLNPKEKQPVAVN